MFIESMLNSSSIKGEFMFRLCLGFLAVLLLVGCSSKEEQALMQSYTEKINYHKQLQQMEKAELDNGDTSMAIITATHLYTPNFEKNDTREEVFIIGVQFENPDSSTMNFNLKQSNGNNIYVVTLNGKTATSVEKLSADDKRLKDISFVTDWGKYYYVKYPHTSSNRFKLLFQNSTYGTATLNFSKVAKYVYTKKGF